MEQYVIKGGSPLYGEVVIGGAKNAALAILAAAIMTDETVTIDNLPNVRDINVLLHAIEEIGAHVERVNPHKVKINGSFIQDVTVDNEFIRKIRASYYLIGALLGKYKRAEVALPGGCDIGSRPIDLHMKGFRAMGATVDISHGLFKILFKFLRIYTLNLKTIILKFILFHSLHLMHYISFSLKNLPLTVHYVHKFQEKSFG